MKASGKTTRRAPLCPASAISSQALAIVASRSMNTGALCTAAILKVDISQTSLSLSAGIKDQPAPHITTPATSGRYPHPPEALGLEPELYFASCRIVGWQDVSRPFKPLPPGHRRRAAHLGDEARALHQPILV